MLNKIFLLSSKNIQKKPKIKRMFNTSNFFFPKHKSKTPSFYQKIYSIESNSLNHSKIENNKTQKKTKKKSVSLENIFKKPKLLSSSYQFRKITNPKLPFSKRTIEPKEVAKGKIKLKKPSKIFHNFETIQWLRKKFSENIINKSIYTLLPNNGKPVIPEDESEEDKRHRKMIEYLESLKEPNGREKYVRINPKYFFNRTTFELVLKLKKIFLEFDADGNRRMELDEMLEMFESNKISAKINDLVDLFFKGKKFKEKEVMKLYLNFHQFINFALTKDQDFRQFMRNIKERAEKEEKSKTKNKIGDANNNNISENEDNEKEGYLPMSFKSLLDYFVDKGKERDSKEIINKAIYEMNEIINKNKTNKSTNNTFNNSSKKLTTQNTLKLNENENKNINLFKKKTIVSQKTFQPSIFKSLIKDMKRINNRNYSKVKSENDDDKMNIELYLDDDFDIDYEKQLKDINFQKLIEEFSNLFNINQVSSHQQKKNILKSSSSQKILENNTTTNKINQIQIEKEKEKNKETIKIGKTKKSNSQSLLNSLSTHSQENFRNNLINNSKGDFSNTFYNFYKPHTDEFSKTNEIDINKKNKLLSANYSNFYKNDDNGKIKYIKLMNTSSRNKNNFDSLKKNFKFKKKYFINESQKELPQVCSNNKIKNNNLMKSYNELYENNEKNNLNIYKHIYPNSQNKKSRMKYDFINNDLNHKKNMNKYFINYYGGKLNLIKINKSFSNKKYDYVPLKLLCKPKHKNESI